MYYRLQRLAKYGINWIWYYAPVEYGTLCLIVYSMLLFQILTMTVCYRKLYNSFRSHLFFPIQEVLIRSDLFFKFCELFLISYTLFKCWMFTTMLVQYGIVYLLSTHYFNRNSLINYNIHIINPSINTYVTLLLAQRLFEILEVNSMNTWNNLKHCHSVTKNQLSTVDRNNTVVCPQFITSIFDVIDTWPI